MHEFIICSLENTAKCIHLQRMVREDEHTCVLNCFVL